ncbi:MAG: FAD-dependent oxidoreductase [Microcoleaceae cyanobacterium]
MNRNLTALTNQVFDVLVVGGGIYGACVAWEASLRGLSVALVEQADFGGATSANSLKTIHGGFRYLQNADFKRMRESIYERRTLMRIAPHLIHPLPVMVPTYGYGMKGKEALTIALAINDLVSWDRNRLADTQKHIPRGRVVSRERCQTLLPEIRSTGLTGGAIFYDAQVYNSERLTLAFLKSACRAGAQVANYVQVTGFLRQGDRVCGVQVQDRLGSTQTSDRFDIQARMVINTTGPWFNNIQELLHGRPLKAPQQWAKAVNLVTTRPLFQTYAVGLPGSSEIGSRFLFVAPWRGCSIVGTWYKVYQDRPEQLQVTEVETLEFLQQINQAYPGAKLKRDEVAWVHQGILPSYGVDPKTGEPLSSRHYQIHDHRQDGVAGVLSVLGVKYTTARDVAQKVVDQVFQIWGKRSPESTSARTKVDGGEIEDFIAFLQQAIHRESLPAEITRRLVYNYGSAYSQVLSCLQDSGPNSLPDHLAVAQAETCYAVQQEMAQTLGDVIFRRTEWGSGGYPGDDVLQLCATTMGQELGWTSAQLEREIQTVHQRYTVAVPQIS